MPSIHGFLYSQIGYDIGCPMRSIVRSTDPNHLTEDATLVIHSLSDDRINHIVPMTKWGSIWKSTWWVGDFSNVTKPGSYVLEVRQGKKSLYTSDPVDIGDHILWEKTMQVVALDQFEERARLARNQKGWKDCGSDWREANSHASSLIGLTDLLNWGYPWLASADVSRLVAQVIQGCDYLVSLQNKAEALGFGVGSIVHEIPNHMVVIPGDVLQSVVALARSSRLISEYDAARSLNYLERAERAYDYFLHRCQPYGPGGFSHMNHGAPRDFAVPDEYMTRDLFMATWGGIELWASGRTDYKEDAIRLANHAISRQVPQTDKEGAFYGHYYTFDHCGFTEKANTHHHVGHDTGSTFPHYIIPLLEMCRRWPDHPDAEKWNRSIRDFAYGYLLPACRSNPFLLLPEGYFLDQGLLTFCGPWHGINTSIGFAASLAAQLESFLGDSTFREIAVGNLQWIAGLHSGVTRESLKGSLLWKDDIAEEEARPYSQIYGVGNRYVGNWTGIRGTIPNGFDTNPQFQLVVEPTVENDGPWLYTDEDWIPHAAGWISALTYLRQTRFFLG